MSRSPLESAIPAGRTEKKSKRGIFYTALLGVAGLGAASSVFAASITLNSGDASGISFSQGTQTIVACDTDGITASFDAAYNTTGDGEFRWSEITLEDVDSGCDDKEIDIQIWSSSAKLVTITGTVNATSDGQTLTVEAATPANGIAAQASSESPDSANTWTLIDGTVELAYESGIDAANVAANGARLLIEIN